MWQWQLYVSLWSPHIPYTTNKIVIVYLLKQRLLVPTCPDDDEPTLNNDAEVEEYFLLGRISNWCFTFKMYYRLPYSYKILKQHFTQLEVHSYHLPPPLHCTNKLHVKEH